MHSPRAQQCYNKVLRHRSVWIVMLLVVWACSLIVLATSLEKVKVIQKKHANCMKLDRTPTAWPDIDLDMYVQSVPFNETLESEPKFAILNSLIQPARLCDFQYQPPLTFLCPANYQRTSKANTPWEIVNSLPFEKDSILYKYLQNFWWRESVARLWINDELYSEYYDSLSFLRVNITAIDIDHESDPESLSEWYWLVEDVHQRTPPMLFTPSAFGSGVNSEYSRPTPCDILTTVPNELFPHEYLDVLRARLLKLRMWTLRHMLMSELLLNTTHLTDTYCKTLITTL